MKSYARFYYKVYERLLQTPPFANRQEVEIWLRDTWLDIHTDAGAGKQRLAILRDARICPEQGWRDVDKDVCYLDSPETPPIRMYVHNDGTLVVQQMHTDRSEILFAKHGAKPKAAPAPPTAVARTSAETTPRLVTAEPEASKT